MKYRFKRNIEVYTTVDSPLSISDINETFLALYKEDLEEAVNKALVEANERSAYKIGKQLFQVRIKDKVECK